MVLYVGGDLSRKRLDWVALWANGEVCAAGVVPPDREGLSRFADQLLGFSSDVLCVIESMTGARFIHDELEQHGIEVQIADARKAKLAAELLGNGGAKTDRLDAHLLAELGRRELVPEIWLPDVACGVKKLSSAGSSGGDRSVAPRLLGGRSSEPPEAIRRGWRGRGERPAMALTLRLSIRLWDEGGPALGVRREHAIDAMAAGATVLVSEGERAAAPRGSAPAAGEKPSEARR